VKTVYLFGKKDQEQLENFGVDIIWQLFHLTSI